MDFFPDASTNTAYDAWKQQVVDCTAHGWVPSDTYLIEVFVDGVLTVDQVAYDADRDWEEAQFATEDRITLYDDGVPFSGWVPATRIVCSNTLIWGVDKR